MELEQLQIVNLKFVKTLLESLPFCKLGSFLLNKTKRSIDAINNIIVFRYAKDILGS